MRWYSIIGVVGTVFAAADAARGQSPDWEHVALGELREVCVIEDGSDRLIWTAEDGGRIRHGVFSSGATTWTMQTTPDAVRQRLLDVFFLPDATHGFACGADGVVLSTDDGGSTWTQLPVVNEHGTSTPALLWGVHFFDPNFGLLAGEKVLHYTTDGGSTWTRVTVNTGGGHYSLVEYYAYDFVLDGSGNPAHGAVVVDPPAILHTTDALLWTPATILDLNGNPATFASGFELWDVSFATDAADPDDAFGVAVGGLQANGSRVFVTHDGGLNWQEEAVIGSPPATVALYGCFAWDGGNAVAAGYAATILRRDPTAVPPEWNSVHGNGTPQICVPNGGFSAPLVGVDGTDGGDLWISGSFGYLGRFTAPSSPTASISPTHDTAQDRGMWRAGTTAWRDASTGYIGSQGGIVKSTNGGVDWTMDACTQNVTTCNDIALGASDRGVFVGTPKTSSDPSAWYLDGSGTWQASALTAVSLTSVQWLSGSTYYATQANTGAIHVSTDHGATFNAAGTCDDSGLSGTPALYELTLYSSAIAFACGSEAGQGVVYATSTLNTSTPTWTRVAATDPGTTLYAIASRGTLPTIEAVAVGEEGVVLQYIRTLNSFQPVTAVHRAADEYLFAVALPAGSIETFIGGFRGRLRHFDGTTWSEMKCETSKAIQDLWFDGPSLGYAAAADGTLTGNGSLGIIGDGCVVRFQ